MKIFGKSFAKNTLPDSIPDSWMSGIERTPDLIGILFGPFPSHKHTSTLQSTAVLRNPSRSQNSFRNRLAVLKLTSAT